MQEPQMVASLPSRAAHRPLSQARHHGSRPQQRRRAACRSAAPLIHASSIMPYFSVPLEDRVHFITKTPGTPRCAPPPHHIGRAAWRAPSRCRRWPAWGGGVVQDKQSGGRDGEGVRCTKERCRIFSGAADAALHLAAMGHPATAKMGKSGPRKRFTVHPVGQHPAPRAAPTKLLQAPSTQHQHPAPAASLPTCFTRPSRSTPAMAGMNVATELRKPAGGAGQGRREAGGLGWDECGHRVEEACGKAPISWGGRETG